MIEFEGRSYVRQDDETVLDCLLRHRVEVSSFCRSGACQSCVLKASAGKVPAVAQVGLKDAHKQQGFFLSCMCRPDEPLQVERCDAAETFASRVTRVSRLSADVLRVSLARPAGFAFRAGQFVQLVRPSDGLMRPYSLASLPEDEELELHVALLTDGKMSGWLLDAPGQAVRVRGPFGECFYQEGEADRPLLLAGTGTGLAPLAGILKAALRAGHRGEITLFHGTPTLSGLYMRAELEALADALPALQLVGSVLSAESAELGTRGRWRLEATPIEQLVLSRYAKLDGLRLYFCGNPALVHQLRKRAYLAGASLSRIHSDAFAAPHSA
ncbi:MAG: 2Fe-2S iron-sulfur cluster-binding protein [Polyangiaceae bacterium]